MPADAARKDDSSRWPDPAGAGSQSDWQDLNAFAPPRLSGVEDLLESGPFLGQIINRIGDPLFVKDEQHRYLMVNDAHCRAIGRRREEILGRTDRDFYPEATAAAFEQADDRVISSGQESLIYDEGTDVHGDVRFFTARKALLTDGSGRRLLVCVARDITDHKRAEQALKQEKLFTDAIIGSLPGYFFVVDCAMRYVRWNKAVEELTGLPPSKLHLWDARNAIHEEDREVIADAVRRIIDEGHAQTEARVVDHTGAVIHLLFTGRRMDIGGVIFIVGTAVDITDRKQAEEALEFVKEHPSKLFRRPAI